MNRKEKKKMINSIEQAIILYAPTVLLYITQIVDWIVTLKKFKALNIRNQITPVTKQLTKATDSITLLEKEIRSAERERESLIETIKELKANAILQQAELSEIKGFLQALSQENIELKAQLRKKGE